VANTLARPSILITKLEAAQFRLEDAQRGLVSRGDYGMDSFALHVGSTQGDEKVFVLFFAIGCCDIRA